MKIEPFNRDGSPLEAICLPTRLVSKSGKFFISFNLSRVVINGILFILSDLDCIRSVEILEETYLQLQELFINA